MLSNIDFGSYFHTKKYEKGLSTGGDKIADWGGSKGGWGGHVPPSLYVKRGPDLMCVYLFVNITRFDLYSVILFCCFYGGNRGKPTGKTYGENPFFAFARAQFEFG